MTKARAGSRGGPPVIRPDADERTAHFAVPRELLEQLRQGAEDAASGGAASPSEVDDDEKTREIRMELSPDWRVAPAYPPRAAQRSVPAPPPVDSAALERELNAYLRGLKHPRNVALAVALAVALVVVLALVGVSSLR